MHFQHIRTSASNTYADVEAVKRWGIPNSNDFCHRTSNTFLCAFTFNINESLNVMIISFDVDTHNTKRTFDALILESTRNVSAFRDLCGPNLKMSTSYPSVATVGGERGENGIIKLETGVILDSFEKLWVVREYRHQILYRREKPISEFQFIGCFKDYRCLSFRVFNCSIKNGRAALAMRLYERQERLYYAILVLLMDNPELIKR